MVVTLSGVLCRVVMIRRAKVLRTHNCFSHRASSDIICGVTHSGGQLRQEERPSFVGHTDRKQKRCFSLVVGRRCDSVKKVLLISLVHTLLVGVVTVISQMMVMPKRRKSKKSIRPIK